MTTLLLALLIAVLVRIYFVVKPKMRQIGPFLPDSMLVGIGLYVVGALFVSQVYGLPHSEEVLLIGCLALVSGLLGSIYFVLIFGIQYQKVDFIRQFSNNYTGPLERNAVNALLLISALICLLFVFFVFSNSVVGALLSVSSLVFDSTLLDARKAISSGTEGYFAPGYVKQFRDIIIPILFIAVMCRNPDAKYKSIPMFALMAALIAMLVTGQRLIFVVLFLTLLLGRYYVRRISRCRDGIGEHKVNIPLTGIAIVLIVYGGLTILLGRTGDETTAIGAVTGVLTNLAERSIVRAPLENVITFPVWQTLGPTSGLSWMADLAAVLPGVGESFSNRLHVEIGGSLQGNSALGLPVDVWFAWGWTGVLVVPFIYSFGAGILDMVLLSDRSSIFFGTRCYLFVVLPICYSPYLFVLYGGAVAIVFIMLIRVLRFHLPRDERT